MICKCSCKNFYQDEKYGEKKRVCNRLTGKENMYRCTVCLKEHAVKNKQKEDVND